MVDRLIDGVTAPTAGSSSLPAWTAMVSICMSDLVLQFKAERRRARPAVEQRIALAIEEPEPVVQSQVAVHVELGMFRIVQPCIETEQAIRIHHCLEA